MRIDNEFTVDAPIERVWGLFTDVEELAPCMPGAQLTEVDGNVYSGKVKVKVGPVVAAYKGTARFVERDDQDHRAVVEASGKAERGAGNAAATITVQLTEEDGRTAVTVGTDLKITGKLAQLGGGMIKDVSERLLGQFVERVENKLATPETTEADTMSNQESGTDPNADEGEDRSGSHTAGGEHMSGGGHMSGGAHMSGGSHMAGSGPLSNEEPDQGEDEKDISEISGKGTEPEAQATPTRRTIDGPEAQPVDLVAASGGMKRLWPVAVVVVVAGLLIGYVVFG